MTLYYVSSVVITHKPSSRYYISKLIVGLIKVKRSFELFIMFSSRFYSVFTIIWGRRQWWDRGMHWLWTTRINDREMNLENLWHIISIYRINKLYFSSFFIYLNSLSYKNIGSEIQLNSIIFHYGEYFSLLPHVFFHVHLFKSFCLIEQDYWRRNLIR